MASLLSRSSNATDEPSTSAATGAAAACATAAVTTSASSSTVTPTTTTTTPFSSAPSTKLADAIPQLRFTLICTDGDSSSSSSNDTNTEDNENRRSQQIVLVSETKDYRALARRMPIPAERHWSALEIGCAYGDCSNILAKRFEGRITGVDISKEAPLAATARFPRLKPDHGRARIIGGCDVLSESGASLVRRLATDGSCFVAFVDIGGDRDAEAVIRVVREVLLGGPQVVVIKCRLLFKAAKFELKRVHIDYTPAELSLRPPGKTGVEHVSGSSYSPSSVSKALGLWWAAIAAKQRLEGSAGIGLPKWQRLQGQPGRRRKKGRNGHERQQVPGQEELQEGAEAMVENQSANSESLSANSDDGTSLAAGIAAVSAKEEVPN